MVELILQPRHDHSGTMCDVLFTAIIKPTQLNSASIEKGCDGTAAEAVQAFGGNDVQLKAARQHVSSGLTTRAECLLAQTQRLSKDQVVWTHLESSDVSGLTTLGTSLCTV